MVFFVMDVMQVFALVCNGIPSVLPYIKLLIGFTKVETGQGQTLIFITAPQRLPSFVFFIMYLTPTSASLCIFHCLALVSAALTRES